MSALAHPFSSETSLDDSLFCPMGWYPLVHNRSLPFQNNSTATS